MQPTLGVLEASERTTQPTLIQTLNGLHVFIDGHPAAWSRVGPSVPQIKKMLGYVVTFPDRRVHWTTLAEIGSNEWASLDRPRNLPGGLWRLLKQWRMQPALHSADDHYTLQRHPCWIRDVDLIVQHNAAAERAMRANDPASAIGELRSAAAYCTGAYLPECDLPEHGLQEVQQYWELYQLDVLYCLSRLLLANHQARDAEDYARKLRQISIVTTPEADALFADIYTALDRPHLASYYRYQAHRKRTLGDD
jgi:hypothetical protein